MNIVADTNIFVISLTSKSPYHKIFTSLVSGKYDLSVSNEILSEYHEVIARKYSERTANEFLNLLSELPNVRFAQIYYRWDLIEADKEDNKFVDCAVATAADYLVTEDNHFIDLSRLIFQK